MLDLLVSVGAATVLTAVGLALLVAVTVVPFVLALQLAEQRRFPPTRWGAVALVGVLLGVAAAGLVLVGTDLPAPVALLPLVLTYAGPGVLLLLGASQRAVGGRAGRHA